MVTQQDIVGEINGELNKWLDVCDAVHEDPLELLQKVEKAIHRTEQAVLHEETGLVMMDLDVFVHIASLATMGKHVVVTRLLEQGKVDPDKLGLNYPI